MRGLFDVLQHVKSMSVDGCGGAACTCFGLSIGSVQMFAMRAKDARGRIV